MATHPLRLPLSLALALCLGAAACGDDPPAASDTPPEDLSSGGDATASDLGPTPDTTSPADGQGEDLAPADLSADESGPEDTSATADGHSDTTAPEDAPPPEDVASDAMEPSDTADTGAPADTTPTEDPAQHLAGPWVYDDAGEACGIDLPDAVHFAPSFGGEFTMKLGGLLDLACGYVTVETEPLFLDFACGGSTDLEAGGTLGIGLYGVADATDALLEMTFIVRDDEGVVLCREVVEGVLSRAD